MRTGTVLVNSVSHYEQAAVDQAVEAAFQRFLPSGLAGKTVAVKPNLLLARTPENASTTHPAVVAAVCRAVVKRGGKALIAESGGGPITPSSLEKLYEATGMKKAAEESGAELNFDCSAEKMEVPEGKTRKEFLVLSAIRRADLIVSVAKLKTHGFMKMTASVKNLYGTIPGLHKAMMHREYPAKKDFASMICDLAEAFRPAVFRKLLPCFCVLQPDVDLARQPGKRRKRSSLRLFPGASLRVFLCSVLLHFLPPQLIFP